MSSHCGMLLIFCKPRTWRTFAWNDKSPKWAHVVALIQGSNADYPPDGPIIAPHTAMLLIFGMPRNSCHKFAWKNKSPKWAHVVVLIQGSNNDYPPDGPSCSTLPPYCTVFCSAPFIFLTVANNFVGHAWVKKKKGKWYFLDFCVPSLRRPCLSSL